ncbi:MAG TPA: hypothetical protein VIV12_10810 [Streptosporangiaceae bacterium]
MNRRGVCYDAGRVMMGQNWRPVFDRDEVRRELQIIKDDLRCSAVRICGEDLDRLAAAGEAALEQGLEVWLSPELWDHSPDETLAYIAEAARRAEGLRQHRPDQLVFSVGSELTLFMQGIVEGKSVFDRMHNPSFSEHVRSGVHNAPLNDFLAKANDAVRQVFHGSVTYASVPLEAVDWRLFDVVSVDLYRDARIKDRFTALVRRFVTHDRPVVITETGCCTYRGAAEAGGMGWAIVDLDVAELGARPPELNGDYVRDEAEQAHELTELLTIFDQAGVDGTFVMTFVAPLSPYSDDPRHDLDMASYSLVKSYGSSLGDLATTFPNTFWDATRSGTTYPDMPWEPKQSFQAVADFYARQARHA